MRKTAGVALLVLVLVAVAGAVPGDRAVAEHAPGRTYYGATSEGGTVTVWLSADGTRIRALYLTFAGAPTTCAAIAGGFPVDQHRFAATITDSQGSVMSVSGVFGQGGRALGTTTIGVRASGLVGCPQRDVSWTALPATMGAITRGDVPDDGFGLVVFGGGNSTQLWLASGCPRASATFWVPDRSGGFAVYIPGTTVSVVNRGWFDHFPGGLLPADQPVIVRCGGSMSSQA